VTQCIPLGCSPINGVLCVGLLHYNVQNKHFENYSADFHE
jgi:hypothetical protein